MCSAVALQALVIPSGQTVALKLQPYNEGRGGDQLREYREQYAYWDLHFHQALDHPYVSKVLGAFQLDNCLATVQELYPRGSLQEHLDVHTVSLSQA